MNRRKLFKIVFVVSALFVVYVSLQLFNDHLNIRKQLEHSEITTYMKVGEETRYIPDHHHKNTKYVKDPVSSPNVMFYRQRIDNISNSCTKRKTTQASIYIPDKMQDNLIIEQKHAILYCGIPKVGSTFWKRTLTVLVSNGLYTSPFQLKLSSVSLTSLKELKKQLTDTELETFLKKATSFIFVREPYARLFSGYVNKIYHSNNMYWKSIGRKVVLKIRKNASAESLKYGHDVTFAEFVKFILYSYENNYHIDRHFVPMNKKCDPCLMPYDFVGTLETFQQDSEYLLGKWKTQFADFNLTFVDFFKEAAIDTARGMLRFSFASKKKLNAIRYPFYNLILRTWSDLQIRGYISKHIPLPIARNDADNVTTDTLLQAINDAIDRTVNQSAAKLQRQEALIEAYRTVSIEDMEKLRHFVLNDCELFGYDDRPAILFDRSRPYGNNHVYMVGL